MGNPGRTESHLMLRTPESQPKIQTPRLNVWERSYHKGRAAISFQMWPERQRKKKTTLNTYFVVHTLSHLTFRTL